MSLPRPRRLRPFVLLSALTVPALLGGCGADPAPSEPASPAAAPTGGAEPGFPVTITSAWGSATIEKRPQRVAVVSSGDMDMAYALGVDPVIAPTYPESPVSPYVTQARAKLGITRPRTYVAAEGDTNVEAVAAAQPDVILAANAWKNDTEFAKLSQIAPTVAVPAKGDVQDMSWADRTRLVAKALGLSEKGEEVIAAAKKKASDVVAAHPAWKGKTYTYVVAHPTQLSYMSDKTIQPGIFEDLGLVKTAKANAYTEDTSTVSMENLKDLDGDTLFIAFPFVAEGGATVQKLQADALWRSVPVVRDKRWAVVPAEQGLASDLAYQDVLSYPWVVEQMTPVIDKAVTGRGGA